MTSLLNTLEIIDVDKYSPLSCVVDFCALVSKYFKGFSIIQNPYPDANQIFNPELILQCLDASFAFKPVFEKYRNVVLTSGTISPMETYARILDFKPRIMQSFTNTLARNSIQPLIVTKGLDQLAISTRFEDRNDNNILRNYGDLVIKMSQIVPDGIVVFFPSYLFMETIIMKWDEMGVLQKILENKLLLIETRDL